MIAENEIQQLKDSLKKKNEEFSEIVMSFLEKNDFLTDEDLENLQDRNFCRNEFHMDYATLKAIPDNYSDINDFIKDNSGYNRYYSSVHKIKSKKFVMTSQLYGTSKSHKDNRTPFINYILNKIGINYEISDMSKETVSQIVGEHEMSLEKEKLTQIKSFITNRGFTYKDNLIENLYLSLKAKPFVILAGTSGTGKSKLAKLFAESIKAEYKLVPVRPDWSDSSDLFGHLDLEGKFIPGAITDFIAKANNNLSKPHILCLDEMNLARVEYYLSDYLSVIETRRVQDGKIVTDPVLTKESFGKDTTAFEKYGELSLPENLYIIGTVNMDETTFPFSKKVLDRANTIEFSNVDLSFPDFSSMESANPLDNINNDFIKSKYLILKDCLDYQSELSSLCEELEKVNQILAKANLHVGYRVRDEIVFYTLNNKIEQLIDDDKALDNAIMQKILPRIQGSSNTVKEMLYELFKYCLGDTRGIQIEQDTGSESLFNILESNIATYEESAKKIAFMIRRFEEDGFSSFWL